MRPDCQLHERPFGRSRHDDPPPPAWGLEKLGHAIHQIGSRAPNEYWHKDASIRGVPQIRRIGIGTGVGFLFAVFALAISVVSFPMLLDRDVSLEVAIRTSIAMVTTNPGPMAAWGLIRRGGVGVGFAAGAGRFGGRDADPWARDVASVPPRRAAVAAPSLIFESAIHV